MFKNYVKTAYRNLVRNRLYSAISVIGLSIGIACCLLVLLYVQHEMSFDRFHTNRDDIYRLIHSEDFAGELGGGTASTSALLRDQLKEHFPEVRGATRLIGSAHTVRHGQTAFSDSVVFVDKDFLSMFSFPVLRGDTASLLNDPRSVVLTPQAAAKYFGNEDPIGQTISIELGTTTIDFLISGIVARPPSNSSIQYDMLVSTALLKYTIPEQQLQTWNIIILTTYVQLAPGVDVADLERRISSHLARVYREAGSDGSATYTLQPLADIHLNPDYDGEMVPSSNPVYSYILIGIAIAVLLIACINFITLTIGRSARRAREVGLRKVLGAQRPQLMRQFWAEALVLSVIGLAIAVTLADVCLPTFNEFAHRQLTLGPLFDPAAMIALVGITVITALVAGTYPGFLLSRLTPVKTLHGANVLGGKNRLILVLIVLQFAISVFLIVSTLVISDQVDYVGQAELGYKTEQVVTLPVGAEGEAAADLLDRFRNELASERSIVDVAGYSYPFGQSWLYISLSEREGSTALIGEDITRPGFSQGADPDATYFYINWVDHHFIPALGINLEDGRNFSEDHASDRESGIIINRTAARLFGLEDPVGKRLPRGFRNATVIGVVEDFHFYPLHRTIEPLVLHLPRHDDLSSISEIAVRIRSDDIPAVVSQLERTWNQVSGGRPFAPAFLDETVAGQYAAERRWRSIVEYSSIMSILITCLGLFGLSSLAVARRTREAGIRKVLGASVTQIAAGFSGYFARLVLIAILVAWPAAYFVMNAWLRTFAYHTDLSLPTFALSGLMVLAVGLLTVSSQTIKVALTNPVDTIKHE